MKRDGTLVWYLNLIGVPDRYGALLSRLGFQPGGSTVEASGQHAIDRWSMMFTPIKPGEHDRAAAMRAKLLELGLKGYWSKAVLSFSPRRRGRGLHPTDFSKPHVTPGGYRLKRRRK